MAPGRIRSWEADPPQGAVTRYRPLQADPLNSRWHDRGFSPWIKQVWPHKPFCSMSLLLYMQNRILVDSQCPIFLWIIFFSSGGCILKFIRLVFIQHAYWPGEDAVVVCNMKWRLEMAASDPAWPARGQWVMSQQVSPGHLGQHGAFIGQTQAG